MNKFKKLICMIAFALSSTTVNATGCYVFGDSLTSPSYSWANYLIREGHNLQVNAVPNRHLVNLVVPPDTKKTDEIDCAIIHLGSNDALSNVYIDAYTNHYKDIVALLEGNLLTVYCVLPPYNELNWNVGPYRQATKVACNNTLDVVTGYYYKDGVHMNPFGHIIHGFILWNLIK